MAKVLSQEQANKLRQKEATRLGAKKKEFEKKGKEFIVPDEHWSGVMPEKYRASLPGKKLPEDSTGETNG